MTDLFGAADWRALARHAINQKTKPQGSLGRLEDVAVALASLQRTLQPSVEPVKVIVFAADHGIARAGVSAYPSEVTAQMVRNFAAGGAAINVLARCAGAALEIVDVGVAGDLRDLSNIVHASCGFGTEDFSQRAAMSPAQYAAASTAGVAAVERAADARLLVLGEMGIGNSSAAAALTSAYLGAAAALTVGPGTGVEGVRLANKRALIERALQRCAGVSDPYEVLRELGGFELVALSAAMQAAADRGIAVLVDGYIACAAALAACRMRPETRAALLFAHRSAEPGHALLLSALNAQPILDLAMRLGEGSGAALAVPIVRAACAILSEMASFEQAGVSREQA